MPVTTRNLVLFGVVEKPMRHLYETKAGQFAGYPLAAIGVAYLCVASHRPRATLIEWAPAAIVALVIGLGMVIICKLLNRIHEVNRPADDAYGEGWDSGYDKGWREGRAAVTLKVVPWGREDRRAVD